MSTQQDTLDDLVKAGYEHGFVSDVESETLPPGLDEDTIRFISAKKNEPEWMLEYRLKAYRHWLTMEEPDWAHLKIEPIDYQAISYYSAPKKAGEGPKSLDEVDPELIETYNKLGIPLEEQKALAGVAVDAVFDSVSVATTFREDLAKVGVIFCSISEAVHEYPELVKQYLGSVVPHTDNFFAALNAAVFSDGTFVYIPEGVRCPMELSTYFRINAKNTGQFERTLIVADRGSYVSYLEGCTAPMRDENQLHAAVVELIALEDAHIKYSTVQNWYPGDENGVGGIYNFVTKRGDCRGHRSHISWTTGGDRLGHHLEVPQLHPAGGRFGGRVLLGGSDPRLPAGRYRHQDVPHRQEHPFHHRLQGHLRCPRAERLPRAGAHVAQGGERTQPHPVRFPAHR